MSRQQKLFMSKAQYMFDYWADPVVHLLLLKSLLVEAYLDCHDLATLVAQQELDGVPVRSRRRSRCSCEARPAHFRFLLRNASGP